MIGGVETCRRVAAVALLAVSSVVPHDGPLTVSAHVVPVADSGTGCALTVGTATTDPSLAADAARAIAAGYPTTDCMPDATVLAAAEARAALPLGGTTTPADTSGGGLVATSGGSGAETAAGSVAAGGTTGATVPTTESPSAVPTVSATVTPTDTTTAGTTTSTTSATTTSSTTTSATTTSESEGTGSSSGGSGSGGSSSGGSHGGSSDSDADVTGSDGTTTDTTADTTTADTTTESTTVESTPGVGADALGWGPATRRDEFDDDLSGWTVDGGTGGKHRASGHVADGVATVPGGTTMSWGDGARSGRWQARLRVAAADRTPEAAILLRPHTGSGTASGGGFVLPVSGGRSPDGTVTIDATTWHEWAVEWSPGTITAYVDGRPWYRTTDTSGLSSAPMDLALQVGPPARMDVDWVRSYPPAAATAVTVTAPTVTTPTVTGATVTGATVTGTAVAGTSTSTSTSSPTTTARAGG